MRIIFLIPLFILSGHSFCQIDFHDRLHSKIVFEEVVIEDKNGRLLSSDNLYDVFYTIDTVINCWSETQPEFTNNYYSGTGYFIVESKNEIDTFTNKNDNRLVDIVKTERDENGNYLYESTVFSLERSLLGDINAHQLQLTNNRDLLTIENESWSIHEVTLGDKTFLIDSCHLLYRLRFPNLNHFTQSFDGASERCTTSIDLRKTRDERTIEYWYEQITHQLTVNEGVWKTMNNYLILLDKETDLTLRYGYQIDDDSLTLLYRDDYKIILKKTLH